MPYSWSTMPSIGIGQPASVTTEREINPEGSKQGGGRRHIPRPTGRASALQHWSTSWWQCSIRDSSWALSQDTPRNLASCSTMVTRSWKTRTESRAALQRQPPGHRTELGTVLMALFLRAQATSLEISQRRKSRGSDVDFRWKTERLGFEPMALGRGGRWGIHIRGFESCGSFINSNKKYPITGKI